ncbi:hypothetical protein [Streptomyces sp. NPDC004250]|uniref:hypothetical protein n=1 Tax=Streptomyces sp. NPDC004250 TaxID=3364692 RepID=UPI00367863CD
MFGLITRRRYLRDLAAERAETRRVKQVKDDFWQQRDEAMAAARTAARQFAEADATNRRLAGRNEELGKRVSALTESDPEYLADLEQQLATAREELAAEKKRADQLQARLDDACGLNSAGVEAGRYWQQTRQDGGARRVKL